MTRMTTWIGMALSAAWLLAAGAAVASPAVGPRETLEGAIGQVLRILQPATGAPVEQRSAEVRRIAQETFDFDEIARLALGSHWNARAPEERAEFVALFRSLLERVFLSQLEGYTGEQVRVVAESVEGELATVRSQIVTRRGTIPLEYRLRERDGRWRVYDVVVGGASLVGSYRSQFDRVIRTESYGGLRDRLLKKSLDVAVAQRPQEAQ